MSQPLGHIVSHRHRVHGGVLAHQGTDDDLNRCDGRWHDQPRIVPVHADHGAQKALGHPVGGLMHVSLCGVFRLVRDVEGFGPLVTVVVARSHLKRSTVRHDGVDANGVPRPREGVPDRSLCFEDRQAEMVHEPIDDVQILLDLP